MGNSEISEAKHRTLNFCVVIDFEKYETLLMCPFIVEEMRIHGANTDYKPIYFFGFMV
jgi:hypothetical protein